MATVYKGLSFKGWQRNKSFVVTDLELVKQDIINHIYTRQGERVTLRGFGTTIQDMLFEPLDEKTIIPINMQIRAVIAFDPRVTLLSEEDYEFTVDYTNRRISVNALLYYLELDMTDMLHINLTFESY